MFFLGFIAALGSSYYRYIELAKIEEEDNRESQTGEELKEVDNKT